MPENTENIGKNAIKGTARKVPEPIKLALEVLSGLEPLRAEKLRKALPAYAMTLSRQGREVTADILRDALAKGDDAVMGPRHVFNRAATPETIEQRYARIVKSISEPKRYCFRDDSRLPFFEIHAAARGNLVTVQELIKRGFDFRTSNNEALRHAAANGHLDVVKVLIENSCDVNAWGGDALHRAAFNGHLDVVKFLIEKGADVRAGNDVSLHSAVFRDHYCTAHFLISKGADIRVLPEVTQKTIKSINENIDHWIKETGDYPPEGFGDTKLGSFDVESVKAITMLFRAEGFVQRVANYYAYEAVMLFGTAERVVDYFEKWAKPGEQPLHDVVYLISRPNNAPDLKSWADAVMQQGPEMAKLVKFAGQIPQPLKSSDGKTYSLTRTREEAARFAYPNGHENPELAALFNKHQMNENDFDTALKLTKKYKAKSENKIPDITIAGESFGMPKAVFKKLPDGDYRGLVLGQITDCCQSIGGAGEDCAKHGFSSENGGFYVVAVNDNKKGEEIIGQSWAWRGTKGELVLDSLETLGRRVMSNQWADLTKEFARVLKKTDVTALHIGMGGATPRDLPFNVARKRATPKDYDGYRDSHNQYKI